MKEVVTTIAAIALLCATGWLVTCGVIKLITLCFGLTFKWSIATGVWLVICLMRFIFSPRSSKS